MGEDHIEQITNLRKLIDSLANGIDNMRQPIPEKGVTVLSSEMDSSKMSLFFGKAWLGKMLGELGKDTPYTKEGERKTVEDIEPTAERVAPVVMPEGTNIQKIDWLRQELGAIIHIVWHEVPSYDKKLELMRNNCYTELCEARFWLGFELERIREAHEAFVAKSSKLDN